MNRDRARVAVVLVASGTKAPKGPSVNPRAGAVSFGPMREAQRGGGRRLTEAALLKHLLMGIGGWQTHIKLVSDLPPAPYGTASVSSRSR